MEFFRKIVISFQPLTILEKHSVSDVWKCSEYVSLQGCSLVCLDVFSGELHFVLGEADKYDSIFGNISTYKDIKDTLEASVSNVLLAAERVFRTLSNICDGALKS